MIERSGPHGFFIALEGIDGSGKTEQAGRLASALRDAGHTVFACADSRAGLWGAHAREWMRTGEIADLVSHDADWLVECFVRDRQELSIQIRAALADEQIVVCDRWEPSTWAYHLAAGHRSRAVVRLQLMYPAVCRPPDMTFWLRVPAEVALARIDRAALAGLRQPFRQRYETPEFLRRVEGEYARMAGQMYPVDASRSPEEVTAQIRAAVPALFAPFEEGAHR